MRKVLFVVALIMAVLVVNAVAGKTNFSGTWTLNTEKSTQPQGDQGGGMRLGGGNFTVTQVADILTVDRTRTDQDGQSMTMTMKYTLDGQESINTSPRGDSKSIAKWSDDGKSLTIETSRTMDMNGDQGIMKSTEVWTLTDEKTLTVLYTREGPNGEAKATMIYDKK